ncbi:hypothetical protein ONZ51_g1099 [Trametes cubensis]|uniref:UDP-N-acetylglucosamine transferase subunit ALG14 n=1 Tax=Trametes cubensis TaxID=1111947 RepID=A0AAD7U2W8_9APHY|nr:hypothetical protein ONZ51_g1099 [Trametes cubensis]
MGVLQNMCLGAIISLAVLGFRLYKSLPPRRGTVREVRQATAGCNLAVFLGSGGHTSEILSLLSAIDFARYSRRIYYISQGDTLSMQKAVDLECAKAADANKGTHSISAAETPYSFIVIPRARHIHQPLLTTPFTAMLSLAASIWHITIAPVLGRPAADVLLLNGPGTCFVLCIAAYINRVRAIILSGGCS